MNQESPFPHSNSKMHRVLIVDDDKEMVNAITRLLALTDNFEIRTACDGFMAMMRFKEWQPDVIVMDIRMPGLDGYELCRRIRTEDVGKGVKIFAISGMISDVEAGKLPAIGIDQFLAKPFDNTELLDKLYTLVNLPSDNR